MLTDYHVHTPLCGHATGEPVEYVAAALRAGLDEIGFADHNPMPTAFDEWRMKLEEFPRYLASVDEARAQYPDYPIRLAMEVDFLPDYQSWIEKLATMADWDYLIGSVHYVKGFEVDHPRNIHRYESGNIEEIWQGYWECFASAARSGFFDFLGHPDLPKKFGFRPAGDLRRFYEPAIQALVDAGVAFEINTAGWRKPVAEAYPSLDFLKLARQANVPLLINSDAHCPEEVGADFPRAVTLAKEAGYTHAVRFIKRRRYEVALPDVVSP